MKKIQTNKGIKINKDNPYFKEISGFRDLRANDQVTKSFLAMLVLILAGLLGACIVGIILISFQTKTKAMVFMADSHGAITNGGFADTPLKITQPMITNQLAGYLVSLRQIPQDMDLKNEYLLTVKTMSTPELFSTILVPMIRSRYATLNGNTIKVVVHTVLPIGQHTWAVDWEETTGIKPPVKYKGNITFTINHNINDPKVLRIDPLGIIVSDFNYSQEI